MYKPSVTFCYGKYSIFATQNFYHITTLENKLSKTCEYQPDEVDDNLIENNHEECS